MGRQAKRTRPGRPSRLILDSGAVIALARGDDRTRAFLARAVEDGIEVLVPSVVIAETVRGRGPRDAPVNRVLSSVDRFPEVDEAVARVAGHLLGSARSDETIDALVIATTLHVGGGRILTGDPGDLKKLAGRRPGIAIHRI